jgi:methylphosphotriester-DNA--protein-cysteine methyltransferase
MIAGCVLQWHHDGLVPYIVFEGKTDHGDGEILHAQQWLARHLSVANPMDEMVKRSKLAERTFKRRFAQATGLTPIAYVQRLRIEDRSSGSNEPMLRWMRSAGASASRSKTHLQWTYSSDSLT